MGNLRWRDQQNKAVHLAKSSAKFSKSDKKSNDESKKKVSNLEKDPRISALLEKIRQKRTSQSNSKYNSK